MLMNINDAANALQAEEKSVIQWIKKERLPAETVRGEYMINRAELLEWATARGLKVDPAVFKVKDDENVRMPAIFEAVEAGGIHYGVKGTDKETLLKNVVDLLDIPPEIDPEFLLQVLLTREAVGTTAIGEGIAIPHVRNPILLQLPVSKIALCFLETPVDFDAPDGKPVTVLFTLTSPTVKVHLHLLSGLSFALRDKRLRAALTERKDRDTILAILKEIQS
ncbi:MAG: PTS sugar transporter subunit IIA [Desulfobacteraceae bacterium]|jgi:PTS system nitrogen regulatory IIA component